jgi:hypothetical protein
MLVNIIVVLNDVALRSAINVTKGIVRPVFLTHHNRCSGLLLELLQRRSFNLSFLNSFSLWLLVSLFRVRINMYIPHTKIGVFGLRLIRRAERVFLLPDGLDHYRDVPDHIDVRALSFSKLTIYSCGPIEEHGRWIRDAADRGASIIAGSFVRLSHPANLNLFTGIRTIVIESPGVECHICNLELGNDTLIVRHPAQAKRVIPNTRGCVVIDAAKLGVGLEEWLGRVKGKEVYLGETFAAILLIETDFYAENRVFISVRPASRYNLTPYLSRLANVGARVL